MRISRILAGLVVVVTLLLVAASAYGLPLQEFPEVPHPAEGMEDCLACHGAEQDYPVPEDHAGRENDLCLACHQPAVAEPIPSVPHPTEGREDCVLCHGTDGVKPFPPDHEGRESDSCLMCHQAGEGEGGPEATPEPTATLPPSAEVVPTPIHEPVLFEENTCIACHEGLGGEHAQITADWAESVHAERGVGCVSCHGGDPTQTDAEASMSPEAGYLGPLPKDRIPGLCGSCHTRVDLMRPFDLPTDQLDQYWQSQHGQALLQGDQNVATCFDCHDGHRVLRAGDPGSMVYPSNEPGMCASCHANEALMAPYAIPINQYELYQDSVHGIALLQNQDLRAPTCSTCHGKHGAAPPGFQEVANVCGQCHTVTEDYYLAGGHRSGMIGETAPRCVTCHGRYDVQPATRDLFVGTEERHCGSCHPPGSALAEQVTAMYEALTAADKAYEDAQAIIATGTERRLILAEQEEMLQRGNTPLIESRALQHNVDLEQVQAKAEESIEHSKEARESAEQAVEELDTRYEGMIVALAIILVTIVALVLIKLGLDRDLEAKRAQKHSEVSQGREA